MLEAFQLKLSSRDDCTRKSTQPNEKNNRSERNRNVPLLKDQFDIP